MLPENEQGTFATDRRYGQLNLFSLFAVHLYKSKYNSTVWSVHVTLAQRGFSPLRQLTGVIFQLSLAT